MNIILIGKKKMKFGGPAFVMNSLKQNLNFDNTQIYDIDSLNLFKFLYFYFFSKKFENIFIKTDIINFHELWDIRVILLIRKAIKFGVPYFFTFHGVLNKWSMKKNKIIKIFFLKVFKKYLFNITNAFHFLTLEEFIEAKELSKNFTRRSFLLQNGVVLNKIGKKKKFLEKNNLKLLYFGRKHPKKGIIDLIEAFKLIKKKNNNIYLKIIGPNSNYETQLYKKIKEYELEKLISIEQPIFLDSEKEKIFNESDYFVLPSYDEADSVAIKEAISFGLPVIISKECKFTDVEKEGVGFVINHHPEDIYKKIYEIMGQRSNYEKKSKLCLEYAQNNFDIKIISKTYRQMILEIISEVKYSSNWF